MTQEILDCLLIKSQFLLLTAEELLEKMDTEEKFEIYCDTICNVIEHDRFFYTSDILIKKLQEILDAKRFSQTHKPEVIHDINEIIDVINSYKNLNCDDKEINTLTWINQQAKIRKLPHYKILKYSLESIYKIISDEVYYVDLLINKKENIQIYNPFYLLGAINFLISEYPLVFTDNEILSYCYSLAFMFQDKVFPKKHRLYSKMAKDIVNSLENIDTVLQPEFVKKYQFYIEKDNN